MDKNYHKEFGKCPVCALREELAEILGKPELKLGGSEDRFLEQLGNELKDRGLARDEWKFYMDVRQGVVLDQAKADAIPIGSEIPGFGIMTDICMDCGCIYAVDITRMDAKKSLAPTPPIPPNRATRRRDARGPEGPPSPFSPS